MMSEDWRGGLAARLKPALEAAIVAAVGEHPDTDIVGVGITTDDDARYVDAFAQTRANLDALVERWPDASIDVRWSIGDWDLDVPAPDPLEPITTELTAVAEATSDRGYPAYRRTVWESIASALASSAADGFFDRWPTAAKVFLPLDSSVSDRRLFAWNAALNDEAAVAELRYFFQVDDALEDSIREDDDEVEVEVDDQSPPTLGELLAALGTPISSPEFLRIATPFADALVDERDDDGTGFVRAPSAGIAFLFGGATLREVTLFGEAGDGFRAYDGFDELVAGLVSPLRPGDAIAHFGEPMAVDGHLQVFAVDRKFLTVESDPGGGTRRVSVLLEAPGR